MYRHARLLAPTRYRAVLIRRGGFGRRMTRHLEDLESLTLLAETPPCWPQGRIVVSEQHNLPKLPNLLLINLLLNLLLNLPTYLRVMTSHNLPTDHRDCLFTWSATRWPIATR